MQPNRHQKRTTKALGLDLDEAINLEAAKQTPRYEPRQEAGRLLDEYLLPADLAAELNICVKTLDRWRIEGSGPPITKIGRKSYYSKTGVVIWLRAREQRSLGRACTAHNQHAA